MEKKPNTEPRNVRYWLLEDDNMLEGIQVNSRTIESLIIDQVNKFKNGADVTKHLGGRSR